MPRTPRRKSRSGIYHVIIRGVNRRELFHGEQDRLRFLETLERYKIETGIKIYGWCLMGNHVHLLLQEGKEDLAVTMKRIGVSYVWYYNSKYRAIGHLFQDRYRSESVENDRYLMTVIRYIHQNPVKAGLAKRPSDWQWSSCQAYYGKSAQKQRLLDSDIILGLFSQNKNEAMNKFRKFNEITNDDKCLDDDVTIKLTDEEARLEIKKINPGCDIAQIKSLPKAQRNELIKKAKRIEGITQRQLARLLGVSQTLISIV